MNGFHIRIWFPQPGPVPHIVGLFPNPFFGPPQVTFGPGWIDIYYPPIGPGGLPPQMLMHFGVHLRGNPLGRRVRWGVMWTFNGQPVPPVGPWWPGRPWQGWFSVGRPPRMIDTIWWMPEPEFFDVPRPIWVQRRVARAPFALPLKELRRESPWWQDARRVDPTPIRMMPDQELFFVDSFFDVVAPPGLPETLILSYEIFTDVDGRPGESTGLQMNAVHVELEPAVVVMGWVRLESWNPPMDRYPIRFELRPVSGAAPETVAVTPAPDGSFTFETTLREVVDIWAKGPHWLAHRIDGVDLAAPTTALVFPMPNGDVVDSNWIDVDDYLAMAAAYEKQPGDPAWNEMADLDGSGGIDIDDYLILASNYEREGMP